MTSFADRARMPEAARTGYGGKRAQTMMPPVPRLPWAPVERMERPCFALQGRKTGGGAVLQLQSGGSGPGKAKARESSNPQDNVRVTSIDARVKLKVQQFEDKQAAEKGMSPQQKMLARYAEAHPKVQAAIKAYKDKPPLTIRQGRRLTPWEQRYSDLWRMEYEHRDKYCSEWEKRYLDITDRFANEYVGGQLYLMENSGYNIAFSQDSPVSVWKFLDLLGMHYRVEPPYGVLKDGMTSKRETFPSTFNHTLLEGKLNPQPGVGKSLRLGPGNF